jgi:hypothetical protein
MLLQETLFSFIILFKSCDVFTMFGNLLITEDKRLCLLIYPDKKIS